MYTFFVILIVVAALLMIFIVLIQESKGGGLSSNFSSSNNLLGVRKTTDFIEKATWGLAIAMVVLSVICAYVAPGRASQQSVVEGSKTPAATQQSFGASQTPAEGTATLPAEGAAAPAAKPAEGAAAPAAKAEAPAADAGKK